SRRQMEDVRWIPGVVVAADDGLLSVTQVLVIGREGAGGEPGRDDEDGQKAHRWRPCHRPPGCARGASLAGAHGINPPVIRRLGPRGRCTADLLRALPSAYDRRDMVSPRIEVCRAVVLESDDPERLAGSYRDTRGVPLEPVGAPPGEFACELGEVEVSVRPSVGQVARTGGLLLSLAVADLDAYLTAL